MTRDHATKDRIEEAAERWARKNRRIDIWARIVDEAYRLATRKRHPAPDAETAVEWASVRVMDADACYGHGTGAIRVGGNRPGNWS